MGIKPNDKVVIHTSMKAIGETEGGPDGVIDAFCEYLQEGMLIVPAHTWVHITPENPVFDVRNTPADIGLIPKIAKTAFVPCIRPILCGSGAKVGRTI